MSRHFVISDIHGCYKTFRYLVEELLQPNITDHIYLLGDYINKGPSSKSVLDYIMHLQEQNHQVIALMGNHEKIMLDALEDPAHFHLFIEKGGAHTLKDFGVDKISQIPEVYISFIKNLPYYYKIDDWLLVHAGLNLMIEDPFSDIDSMLNVREIPGNPKALGINKIVHGHVPVPLRVIIRQMSKRQHWNYYLDGGCVYPYRRGMGFLVAMDLQQMKLFVKECIDEVEF